MNSCRTELADRNWPHIGHALHAETYLPCQMMTWHYVAAQISPAEVAAGYEEWADFFEYRLAQMADELATDPSRRYLMETWMDDMACFCRRCAACARGEDPGEWIPQRQRRPDIFVATQTELDANDDHDANRQLIGAGMAR